MCQELPVVFLVLVIADATVLVLFEPAVLGGLYVLELAQVLLPQSVFLVTNVG